jgi:hypothetical protein
MIFVGRIATLLALGFFLTGCVTTQPDYNYSAFREADPHSILVVPPINNAVDVDATAFYLATISRPVGERGYYIFPVGMVKGLLDEEGLSDENLVHESDPRLLADMFGADSILYVTIDRWDAQYAILATSVTVELDYLLLDGKSGEELWSNTQSKTYTSDSGGSGGIAGLIAAAVVAAVEKAAPRYVPLAKQANMEAANTAGKGVPAGIYHPMHGKDGDLFSSDVIAAE